MNRVLFPVLLLAACGEAGVDCTAIAVTSVVVTVMDDAGSPVENATVTYTVDGGVQGTCLEEGDPGQYFCGVEEAGEFEITASAEFTSTETGQVTVGEDECHPIPETLTLTLELLG